MYLTSFPVILFHTAAAELHCTNCHRLLVDIFSALPALALLAHIEV